jgi:hypothetical protein
MLPNTHAKEDDSHTPPRKLAVFLTHASPPSHTAADSELINAAAFGSSRNRRARGGKGFNRRVSISVLYSNARDLRLIGAPKLSACVAGIESVRYDFDKISLVTFFLGKKVTLSINICRAQFRESCCRRESGTLLGNVELYIFPELNRSTRLSDCFKQSDS